MTHYFIRIREVGRVYPIPGRDKLLETYSPPHRDRLEQRQIHDLLNLSNALPGIVIKRVDRDFGLPDLIAGLAEDLRLLHL
jgi:hypothetical protein